MVHNWNQSGYEPLNLENGWFLNSDNFDATDLRFFLFSTFPAVQYQRFFSLFNTFSHHRNLKKIAFSVESLHPKDSNMFRTLAQQS